MKNIETYCPVKSVVKYIGDFWNILIIMELLEDSKRFKDLQNAIPEVTSATLSTRLKLLTSEGFIEREQFQTIPPKVVYSLTEKGQDLSATIKSIRKYGNKWY